jgi:hypothetical protein
LKLATCTETVMFTAPAAELALGEAVAAALADADGLAVEAALAEGPIEVAEVVPDAEAVGIDETDGLLMIPVLADGKAVEAAEAEGVAEAGRI